MLCKLIYSDETTLATLKEILQHTNIIPETENDNDVLPGEITTQSNNEFEPIPILPGTPVVEIDAREQSKRWSVIDKALQEDGLETDFFGIVINGRVTIIRFKGGKFSKYFFFRLLVLSLRKTTFNSQSKILT